ncbi:lipopolysaccharide export system permease protein LptF [Mariprofundus micogutta]|uniref:Lipopolysaccharide export system permease protein LptF n=1 Tax=Mariprofundus micogutta TaxID=1921010 RepID=A0A1L8CN04_9PROT|nr:LptF/LptG family permease [Mariprofundus micogutta]GAV20302.1 lipopolysaccharide export system permease protein LptF [Mariprofundus micogutta]
MILDRYILRLWLGPFMGGLILVMGVLLLGRALKLLGTVSDSGQAWALIAELLVLTMPYFLLLTVPMAFFLSMQNTISALQQNSEMDALRASGISYTRIFRSFFGLVIALWLALTYTSMVLLPQGQLGFNNILTKIYAMKGVITFSPQRFTQGFDGVTVYVDGEDEQGTYHGVILEDHRDGVSVIYTAESARFVMIGNYLELKMQRGVRLEGQADDQRMLTFDDYVVSIPVSDGNWQKRVSSEHVTMMTVVELWQAMNKSGKADAVAEWNRRILLPTTVLVLFFFALPLSITQKRSGKAGSLIAGIALLVVIYNVQLMLHRQVSQGAFPGWTMWASQIAMMWLGIFSWKRAEQGHMPKVFSRVGDWLYWLHQAIQHRVAHRWEKKS